MRSSLTLKSGVEKVSIAFIYFYRKDRFCCQEYTGKWFRGLKPKCPAHPLYSHQECHRLRTDMIPPLSCAVQSVFKNAALATSGLLPCDYFKPVFDSLCGLWFLPLPHVGLPTSLQCLVYQYFSTLMDSLGTCPKTSFGFFMGTCRTFSMFIIDMAPCSCSCRAGTLFFMPGLEGLVPPPSPRASPCLLRL